MLIAPARQHRSVFILSSLGTPADWLGTRVWTCHGPSSMPLVRGSPHAMPTVLLYCSNAQRRLGKTPCGVDPCGCANHAGAAPRARGIEPCRLRGSAIAHLNNIPRGAAAKSDG